MQTFRKPLEELAAYQELNASLGVKFGVHTVTGCIDSQKAHLVFGLGDHASRKIVLEENEQKAQEMLEECRFFDDAVCYYPPKDILFYEADIRGNLLMRQRMEALRHILEDKRLTVVTTIDALMDRVVSPDDLINSMIAVKSGEAIDLEEIARQLVKMGYTHEDQVENAGQFAVRGGILDIYSMTEEMPWRIELWGDEVDSIRSFDAESQRSVENVQEVTIYPASDIPRDGSAQVTFLDFFDRKSAVFFLDEPNHLLERGRFVENEYIESVKNRLEKGYITAEEADQLRPLDAVTGELNRFCCVALCTLDCSKEPWNIVFSCHIDAKSVGAYNGSFEVLTKDLLRYKKEKYRIVLLSGSRTRAKRLADDLRDAGLASFYGENFDREIEPCEIMVAYGKVYHGYEYPLIRFLVLTENDIFGKEQKKRKKHKQYDGEKIQSFMDLKIGDYVVHENHGLGIYRGIEKMEMDGIIKDYMKIEYAGGDNLYISASGLDVIQKYSGAGGHRPKLNKIGSSEWGKTKSRVQGAVKEIAQDLINLYAARQSKPGYAFGPDTVWQREFEELFEYDETDDQLSAIDATKRDMESTKIMERLICGDVGYGKTEIAIRAAFKAVQESKQVAILVPTTILAQQHYNTFVQRMKDFPVRIDLLCRFRSDREQKKTVADLASGRVDIVIGTHRLLSKDISFKDLGLLVIDEEQRFGVAHKEKIKRMKENVDVLTMTATPIPRTLHMSLIGIRDMSILEEPPTDRVAVQTYVMEYNEETVREAISRELVRGGQVYYVYNRVETIAEITAFLQKLLPEASIAYAHGQMAEKDLERVMVDFINGDIDVLVSTTIIETGLDIPNVNTMIIHDADTMGLAQLYQLRGRVGRSNRTAYAFLMYRRNKMVKEVAEKRLHAIREFTELGSGFHIAMRDLEIRGAGNLLGARQHGHMEAVGYDLYCKMLQDAVRNLKGSRETEDFATAIDLAVDAFIPDTYIANEVQKLDIYKRIADIHSESEEDDIADELTDRFGNPPRSVMNLLEIAILRARAHDLSLTEVTQEDEEYRFVFYEHAQIDPAGLPDILKKSGGELTFTVDTNPYLTYRRRKIRGQDKEEDPFTAVKKVFTAIKTLPDQKKGIIIDE